MWIFIVLQLIIIIVLVLLLLIGPILMITGKVKQNHKLRKLGFQFFLVPLVVISTALIYYLAWEMFAIKPTKTDLVGTYKLTNSMVSKSKNATLHLYGNGVFEKSMSQKNGAVEKGKYSLYDDEVWFRCDSHATVAKVVRGFSGFKLKFIIGSNSNTDENLIFEKEDD